MAIFRNDETLWCVAVLWLALASGGLFAMADYGAQAGEFGDPPTRWPRSLTQSQVLPTNQNLPTLVLFAHPLCPCTRASLWELESMTNRLYGMVKTHIVFYEPSDTSSMPEIWEASDLKSMAKRLPGATSHTDIDGELAKHFGAYTSGQVLLYDSSGHLQFAGGITPSRGHTGTNPGRARVISAIVSDESVDPLAPVANPVFGCQIHEAGDDDRKLTALTSPS